MNIIIKERRSGLTTELLQKAINDAKNHGNVLFITHDPYYAMTLVASKELTLSKGCIDKYSQKLYFPSGSITFRRPDSTHSISGLYSVYHDDTLGVTNFGPIKNTVGLSVEKSSLINLLDNFTTEELSLEIAKRSLLFKELEET